MQPIVSEAAFDAMTTTDTAAPPPEAPPSAPVTVSPSDGRPEPEPTAEPAAEPDPEPPVAAAPKERKASPQERINKAIKAQREAEREAAYWREQAQRVPQVAAPSAAPRPQGEPTFDQFSGEADPYLAYTRALARWEAKQELAQTLQQQSAQQSQQQLEIRARQHAAAVDQLLAAYPDGETLRGIMDHTPVTPELSQALFESELSAPLVVHLAQHPDEFAELSSKHGAALHRALGKLESRVEAAATGPAPHAASRPAIVPIQPVGASPVVTTPDPTEQDFGWNYVHQVNKADGWRGRRIR